MVLEVVSTLASAVAALCAAYTIKITIKEQKYLHDKERERAITSQSLLWYNELALRDIKQALDNYIEETNHILKEIKKEKIYDEKIIKTKYDVITEKHGILCEKFRDLIIFDPNLYKNCDDNLQKIFDIYGELINTMCKTKILYECDFRKIQRERVDIIKNIYTYGKKIMEETDCQPA